MADTKKVEEIKDITVSAKVLAECIGVGDRMIRYLADEGRLKQIAAELCAPKSQE